MAITKEKGDLGQSLVMADLFRKGHKVLLPMGEDWRFDLVVYRNNRFERVQCKFDNSKDAAQYVTVRTRSCNNWNIIKYTSKDIDWIATYHAITDRVYYVSASLLSESGKSDLKLRLVPTKNNQKSGVLYAEDFLVF